MPGSTSASEDKSQRKLQYKSQKRFQPRPSTSTSTASSYDEVPFEKAVAPPRDAMETDKPKRTYDAGSIGNGKDGSMVIARPINRYLDASTFTFNLRYFFTMSTFQEMQTGYGTGDKAYVNQLRPLYTFSPAVLGQYLTRADFATLSMFGQAGFNVRIEHIKGSLHYMGLNATFLTQAEPTATNSQISMSALRGSGLERIVPVTEGTITIDNATATPTAFTSAISVGGNEDVGVGCFNFMEAQISRPVTGNITSALTAMKGGANCNFVDYNQVSAVRCAAVEANGIYETLNEPLIGQEMTTVDMTESEGLILDWNLKMNECYFSTQRYAGITGFATAKATTSADHLINLPKDVGAAVVSHRPASTTDRTMSQFTLLAHNNCTTIGDIGDKCFEIPPKEYLLLVPPPLRGNVNTTQNIYLQCSLDTEMTVTLNKDHINTFGMKVSGDFGHQTSRNKHLRIPKDQFIGSRQVFFNGNPAEATN